MGRLSVVLVAVVAIAGIAVVETVGARQAKTLRFTALFLPGGRVVAHPPSGARGDETYVSLKLTGMPGTGTVYTLAAEDGRSTRYRFRFVLKTGTIGLVGTISATSSGGTRQTFRVTPGTGAYKTTHGTATLGKRPGGAAGIVVTILLK